MVTDDPTSQAAQATEPAGTEAGFALFDTAIGACALAWTSGPVGPEEPDGPLLTGAWLPGSSPQTTRRSVLAQCPTVVEQAPPPAVQAVIDRVIALFEGAPVDFDDVALDQSGLPHFNREVYRLTRQIGPGSTASYGQLAARLGQPGAARAVGRALGNNPWPIIVPCHRVLAADGTLHGFSAHGGLATKRRMLQIEGALAEDEPTLF